MKAPVRSSRYIFEGITEDIWSALIRLINAHPHTPIYVTGDVNLISKKMVRQFSCPLEKGETPSCLSG